jgi:hypothetical protein
VCLIWHSAKFCCLHAASVNNVSGNTYGCVEIFCPALRLRLSMVTETNINSFVGYKSIFQDSGVALVESLYCSPTLHSFPILC